MAMRILPLLTVCAITALSACAGGYQQPTYTQTDSDSCAECLYHHRVNCRDICGFEPASSQVAAAVPVAPPPVTRPVHAAPIEYYAGQPLVRISFPGVASFRCVLDTGASDLVIPLPFLVKLGGAGLNPNTDMEWLSAGRSLLAGGGVIKHVNVSFHRIDIGPWTLRNVPASIIPDGDCLLGMSILKAFGHPMIDFANQRLILED